MRQPDEHDKRWKRLIRLCGPILRRRFGLDMEAIPADEPAVVVSNHVTNMDPMFLAMAMTGQMPIFVASDHILRNQPKLRAVMDDWFLLIYRRKGVSAVETCRKVVRVLREGRSVCLFAEGETTWNGKTGPIHSGTETLLKVSGAPLVTYRMHGGYFTAPRWGRGARRGRITGRVTGILSPEQMKGMSVEEIRAFIEKGIGDDACGAQLKERIPYRGRHAADQIECLLYLCPGCGGIGTLRGKGKRIRCACGLDVRLDRSLLPEDGRPFTDWSEWDQWQNRRFRELLSGEPDMLLREKEEDLVLWKVEKDGRAEKAAEGGLSMDGEALSIGDMRFPLSEITELSLLQNRKMAVSLGDRYYEIHAPGALCLRKYLLRWQWRGEEQ